MSTRAVIRRESGIWTVRLQVLRRGWTAKARSLRGLRDRLEAQVPDDVDYALVHVSTAQTIHEAIELGRQVRATAEKLEELKNAQRRVVFALSADGLTVRDVAELVGLSHQRVQQILKPEKGHRPTTS